MPTFTWTYVGDATRRHHIGLFHGKKTGHVLIYVNARVVTIDFSVLESKTYSFFINEELCEIRLERKGDTFYYSFHINDKVDTPLNRRRKELARKHWKQMGLFLGGMALVILLGVIGFNLFKKNQASRFDEAFFSKRGETATAVLRIDSSRADPRLTYHFIANAQGYSGTVDSVFLEKYKQVLGIPIRQGDEFEVSYIPTNPSFHRLLYNQPSEEHLKRLFWRVTARHKALHPDQNEQFIHCLVQAAYEVKGLEGLGDFYFQEQRPEENVYHNQLTYLRLTRDLPFQEKVEEMCW